MITTDKTILSTRLYTALIEKEKETDSDSTILSTSIQNTSNNLSIILERVCVNMKEYTLHNIKHCYNVLEIIADILPECVKLNLPELYLLIQAVIFHDLGMAPSHEDVTIMKSEKDYEDFIVHNDWLSDDEVISEYIRKNHVKNSTLYMERYVDQIAKVSNISVTKWINNIILSHGLSVSDVQDSQEQYPNDLLIGEWSVNIGYISLLLRLGDILDFDQSRTPAILYAHITPHNHVSLLEWQKHLSITGRKITSSSIRFDMNSKDVLIERKVKDFMESINKEIAESIKCIKKSNLKNYELLLNDNIELHVYREGYLYNNYEIKADYFGLSKILMGQQLYTNKDAFIRELLQNSIDACRVRKLDIGKIDGHFDPKITITYDSTTHIFTIEDNGCGIDEEILTNYILKIGRSYYYSRRKDFENKGKSPINKFGIGLLSNFMVSDTITIESRRYITNTATRPIWFELNINSTYVNQKESNRNDFGTKITLHLNSEFTKIIKNNNLLDLIQKYYFGEDYTIKVVIDDSTYTIKDMLDEEIRRREQYIYDRKIELGNIPGIKGAIYFKSNCSDNYASFDSIISYKGFKLGSTSHAYLTLFSSYNIVINIDDPIQLDLNTSRENIILNEKWYKLSADIFDNIITKSNSMDFPIAKYIAIRYKAAALYHLENKQMILLWKTIQIEYWNDCKWEGIDFYTFISDSMKNTKKILAINLENNYSSDLLSQLLNDKKNDYTIIKYSYAIDLPRLLQPFISSCRYFIFQEYEIIPIEFSLKLIDDIDGCKYDEANSEYAVDTINSEGNDFSLYLFFQLEESFFINAVINKQHPLTKLTKLNKRAPALQIYIDSIRYNITNGFMNDIKLDEFKPEEATFFSEIWNGKSDINKRRFLTEEYITSANNFFDEKVLPNIIVEPGLDYHLNKTSFPSWYLC